MQKGKSFIEILCVLAIVAILTIAGIWGLMIAYNIYHANTIMHESRMAYIEIHDKAEASNEWTPVTEFQPTLDKKINVMRDVEGYDFVQVEDVPQGVCKRLLNLIKGSSVHIYHNDGTLLGSCEQETETLILSFENTPEPTLTCETWEDCCEYTGKDYNGFCQIQFNDLGFCKACPLGQLISSTKDSCQDICTPAQTLCVNVELQQAWCCDAKTEICGKEMGEEQCITSDNSCIYDFKTPEGRYETECEYSFFAPSGEYKTECMYTFSYTNGGGVSLSENKGCKSGEYCYLAWQTASWKEISTPLVSSSIGKMYGVCLKGNQNNAAAPFVIDSSQSHYRENKGCKDGEYCYLAWETKSWAKTGTALSSSSVGKMYGVCLKGTQNNAAAPFVINYRTPFKEELPCPATKYCNLKWKDDTCEGLTSSDTGKMYGVCLDGDSSAATCPFNQ